MNGMKMFIELFLLFLECVLKRNCTSSVLKMHSWIGSQLRMAPFRKGGTGKGYAHIFSSRGGEAGLLDSSKDDADRHGDDHDDEDKENYNT